MSAARKLQSEDQFLCSICLDVFTDPVSTPCGHNFCKNCIDQHWNQSVLYKCPICNENFGTKPQLKINTFISEIVSQFRHEGQQKSSSSSSEQQAAKPGEVPCDICTGTKLKALQSCLVCLVSYCETHLEPHLTMKGLKIHQLTDPVENLEDRMCSKHHKPLELFCKTDQACVCLHCTYSDHRNHDIVPLTEECEGKKADLGKKEAEIQQMIQKRRLKIEEIKESVKKSKEAADREKAEGVQVFTALKESVERCLNELIKEVEDKQKTAKKQAEDSIKDLEQEISELMKRSSEVEQLLKAEDHLHLLQSFSSLEAAPPTKDWTEVRVRPPSYEGTVMRAVAQLEEKIKKQMKKFELKWVQQYEVDVILDPDRVHPCLILSDDGKQVKCDDLKKNLQENSDRIYEGFFVTAKQIFSSGRFYFEVQVKGKTEWFLGVHSESDNSEGNGSETEDTESSVDTEESEHKEELEDTEGTEDKNGSEDTEGDEDGFWGVGLLDGNIVIPADDNQVLFPPQSLPEKVGVFVDYEEGLVSFYNVDVPALIYSFSGCSFNEKLHLFFSPGENDGGINSEPLIITSVNEMD
ncbi:E3 ubiquitin-protein ligase TRIM21-like isoform 1-T4 [Pholidichthys leucotaenia]